MVIVLTSEEAQQPKGRKNHGLLPRHTKGILQDHISSLLSITGPFSHAFGFKRSKCTRDQTHTGSELTKNY